MINIGAYAKGSNPKIDLAMEKIDSVNSYLIQKSDEHASIEDSVASLEDMTKD
jgi:flagellum-specific ATP synthase